MRLIYLAGPITGLSYGDCVDWREYAQKELLNIGILGLSPMRAKNYLAKQEVIRDSYDEEKDIHPLADVLSSERGITTRDRWDCQRSHIVLFNLLGAKDVSIGTMIEIGWADASRVPSVVVMESEGNPHEHGMVRDLTGFRVTTLDDGLTIIKSLLTPTP